MNQHPRLREQYLHLSDEQVQNVLEQVQQWIDDPTVVAYPDLGWPYKVAHPVFRLSADRQAWETSWGSAVPLSEIDATEFAAVVAGQRASTMVGIFEFAPDGPDHFKLGCLRITAEQARQLLEATP